MTPVGLLLLACASGTACPSPWVFSVGNSFELQQSGPTFFELYGRGIDDLLVKISMQDGSVEYGKNYTPNAAASVFWDAVATMGAARCKP
jgi:hypothetical protein